MILLGYATNESNMSNIEYNRISNHLKMVNTTIPKQQSTIIIISDHEQAPPPPPNNEEEKEKED